MATKRVDIFELDGKWCVSWRIVWPNGQRTDTLTAVDALHTVKQRAVDVIITWHTTTDAGAAIVNAIQ